MTVLLLAILPVVGAVALVVLEEIAFRRRQRKHDEEFRQLTAGRKVRTCPRCRLSAFVIDRVWNEHLDRCKGGT